MGAPATAASAAASTTRPCAPAAVPLSTTRTGRDARLEADHAALYVALMWLATVMTTSSSAPSTDSIAARNSPGAGAEVVTDFGPDAIRSNTSAAATSPSRMSRPSHTRCRGTTVIRHAATASAGSEAAESVTMATVIGAPVPPYGPCGNAAAHRPRRGQPGYESGHPGRTRPMLYKTDERRTAAPGRPTRALGRRPRRAATAAVAVALGGAYCWFTAGTTP